MLNAFESYLFGLILTDGYIETSSNGKKGKISIELRKGDEEILYKIAKFIPEAKIYSRCRNTNFREEYESTVLYICDRFVRDKIIQWGIPLKNKSLIGTIPNQDYSESDFWRGVYDGNGSLGFTGSNEPYISLVVKSDFLKERLIELLNNKFGIIKRVNKNKRDNIYNIILKNEDAVRFSKFLYENKSLAIPRKYLAFLEISKWVRLNKKKVIEVSWSDFEIEYIQNHSIAESVSFLNRSVSSVKNKLFKVKQSNKNRTIS